MLETIPPSALAGGPPPAATATRSARTMLVVDRLSVSYGEVAALCEVSLRIERGEVVTLIGANGAGKSTMLRAVSGLVKPSGGHVFFEGNPIGGLPPDRIVSLGIAHVPEGRRIFPQLSVEDNLRVGAHLVRDPSLVAEGMEDVYAMFPRLAERRRQPGGTLSGGEQQMLALGRAMMSRPRLLFLDEPSLGLAPRVVEDVARAVLGFRDRGITVLLVEQNARVALAISDRGYVIENGRIVLSATAAELRADPVVAASYLGGRAA